MSKGVAFGADSGTVALALSTGEASMPIPETVKVTFKGKMADHMDFRDVVHATQSQMLALGVLSMALMDVMAKILGHNVPVAQIVWLRFLSQAILIGTFLAISGQMFVRSTR